MTTSQQMPGAPEAESIRPTVTGPDPRTGRLGTSAMVVAVAGLLAAFLLSGPALSAEPTTTTGAAGDTLSVGDLRMTASTVTPRESMFGPTLCSTVTYRNSGSAPESIDALYDWKLRDPSGEVVPAGVSGTDSSLTAGQLAGGRTISGDVCFDHTAARSGRYVVRFDPMGFSSERAAWTDQLG